METEHIDKKLKKKKKLLAIESGEHNHNSQNAYYVVLRESMD